jgi:hypothetical protein
MGDRHSDADPYGAEVPPMSDTPTFRDMQNCCTRKVNKRRHVHPRLAESGRMTQEKVDREIRGYGRGGD